MEEEGANSWIWRTRYSRTVYHNPSTLNIMPFAINATAQTSGQTSRREREPTNPPTNQNATSQTPTETIPIDAFKEAQLSHKSTRSTSPLSSTKKNSKESRWTKYFGGGRVKSVETVDVENMVDLSKLFLGSKFAHGAHSSLYEGFYMEELVAVKMIIVPDDDQNGAVGSTLERQFVREVTLLSQLHHENIIKLVGAFRKPSVFCIITEYLPEGSLRSYLHKHRSPHPMPTLISMALDIARGMEYMHSHGVIHRGLKPENILVTRDLRLKVADYGTACDEARCDLPVDDGPGTYRWMAPEMIKQRKYGRKVDVYGFGLVLWELVTGAIPYDGMTPVQAAFAVANKNLRPPLPNDCPQAMKALIEQCWSLQPEKRPEFKQIVKVLEEFRSSLALDGTLNLVRNRILQDPKKGFFHWIHKPTRD